MLISGCVGGETEWLRPVPKHSLKVPGWQLLVESVIVCAPVGRVSGAYYIVLQCFVLFL